MQHLLTHRARLCVATHLMNGGGRGTEPKSASVGPLQHWDVRRGGGSVTVKSGQGARRPRVLIAISVPCDEAFQARWATEGFYFQLHSGGSGNGAAPFDAIGRLGRLCKRLPNLLNVHVNCFSRPAANSEKKWLRFRNAFSQELSSCASIRVSTVPGMKGLFWKHALHPRATDSFDYLWLIDADMDVTDRLFSLARLLRDMHSSNASMAQPRIKEATKTLETAPLGVASPTTWARSTDIQFLRASAFFPAGNCSAVHVDVVEVMAPLFRSAAWRIVHHELISVLPDELLARTDWGITATWCNIVRRFSDRPACALLHESIIHLDEHMIERAGLDNLTYDASKRQASDWALVRKKALNENHGIPGIEGSMDAYFRGTFARFYRRPGKTPKWPRCMHETRAERCQRDLSLFVLAGYSCARQGEVARGVSYQVDQLYEKEGSTADGRPWYRGVSDPSSYLYYTTSCGGTGNFGWGVFRRAPSLTATSNVNGESGACGAATILLGARTATPPTSAVWWQYCGPIPVPRPWSTAGYERRRHLVEACPSAERAEELFAWAKSPHTP